MAARVDSAKPLSKSREVQVNWQDGHASIFNGTWLRVNCPTNLHPSGQRLHTPGDLLNVKPVSVQASEEHDGMEVQWSDGHASFFASEWLRAHDNSVSTIIDRNQSSWPAPLHSWEAISRVEAEDVLNTDEGVFRLLRNVNNSGLCTIENVGTEPGTVSKLAERVSPISHAMLYGNIFDVISQDNARNIAFTKEKLRPHQDLVYYESPPGLQLLHCLANDDTIQGGESCYIDGFEAAKEFRKKHNKAFKVLSTTLATFQKIRQVATLPAEVEDLAEDAAPSTDRSNKEDSHHNHRAASAHIDRAGESLKGGYHANVAALSASYMTYQRPHIQVAPDGEITGIFWAPMFEGTLHAPTQVVQAYYEAYALFEAFLTDSDFAQEFTIRARLQPGQCVVFNNRRMLHGREGFSGSGSRHLQGCYTNVDESLSRYIVLHEAHARLSSARGEDNSNKDTIKRWGNGSVPLVVYGLEGDVPAAEAVSGGTLTAVQSNRLEDTAA